MAYSPGTVRSSSPAKGVYDPKAFFPHAASLGQAFAHCPRFLAAASRRSRGRVSVPVWLVVLSDQLPVLGLVSRYLTNYLIGRRPLPQRLSAFLPRNLTAGSNAVLVHLSAGYPPLWDRLPTRYSAVRHSPANRGVRLACVRRAASVRPEPGSNPHQIDFAFEPSLKLDWLPRTSIHYAVVKVPAPDAQHT